MKTKKKKVFTQVLIVFFYQKASEHTHTKKGHFDGFCGILLKASTKEIQGLVSATHNVSAEVSINQPMQKPLARATLKPLAGHLWPAGCVLDAPALIDGFRSSVYQKLAFLLAVTTLPT